MIKNKFHESNPFEKNFHYKCNDCNHMFKSTLRLLPSFLQICNNQTITCPKCGSKDIMEIPVIY